jgi:hypothetical protein
MPPFTGFQQRIMARERQEFDLRAFARRAGYDVEYLRKQVQELNSTWPSERKSWRCPVQTN